MNDELARFTYFYVPGPAIGFVKNNFARELFRPGRRQYRMPVANFLWILAAYTLVPQPAHACSCGPRTPFCEKPPASSVLKDTSVFLGTVESIYSGRDPLGQVGRAPEDPEQLLKFWQGVVTPAEAAKIRKGGRDNQMISQFQENSRLIRFRVEESFVGARGQSFELLSGGDECCDCNMISFEAGRKYFVVAKWWESRWTTGICAGTTTAGYGKLEIDALRAWKRGQRTTPAILGSVIHRTSRPDHKPGDAHATTGLRITLSGKGVERETRTDAEGTFMFSGLAHSEYKLQMAEPGWTAEHDWNPRTQIIDLTTKACASPYFSIKKTAVRRRP